VKPSNSSTAAGASNDAFVSWAVGSLIPKEFGVSSVESLISSTLIPRTVGWISAGGEDRGGEVALLEGFTAGAYTPPTLYFAASALPPSLLEQLLQTKKCTVSAATTRESEETMQTAAAAAQRNSVCRMDALGLTATTEQRDDYPRAVASSPIHMYCTLRENVALPDDKDDDDDKNDRLIVLTVETFVVDGSVLADPTNDMKNSSRSITAKIDAARIAPRVGLGNGRQYPALASIRSMPRPVHHKSDGGEDDDDDDKAAGGAGTWTSTHFDTLVEATGQSQTYDTMEWKFRTDGRSCPLGFNPVTALVMPRPIGWISTYSKQGRVEHLAPYSFFIDVARKGTTPMVGFSAYRRDGTDPKDAQKDAEETGCFCFNLCNEALAVSMNLSAAELKRDESEFALAGLASRRAELVDAPCVDSAPVVYECEYVRTVDVESFSIVIGAVKRVSVNRSVLLEEGGIDVQKLRPITRMGYMDEYGVLF